MCVAVVAHEAVYLGFVELSVGICFTGDGGFWYHLSELETAVRAGINTVTIINNNRSLNQDSPGVNVAYRDQDAGNPKEMWMYRNVDLSRIAEEVGCVGIRVEKPAEIHSALERAMTCQRPVVVDVATDIEAFAPWTSKPS